MRDNFDEYRVLVEATSKDGDVYMAIDVQSARSREDAIDMVVNNSRWHPGRVVPVAIGFRSDSLVSITEAVPTPRYVAGRRYTR